MRFGKTIAGKGCHHFPDVFADLDGNAALGLRFVDKLSFQLLHLFSGVEMAHCAPEQISFCKAEACQFIGDP